ncbi:MAG: hypothetical protein KAI79_05360 [Bacteroidales bacterium]|nr:hypothetical protein [Bacteroidales bacterium]
MFLNKKILFLFLIALLSSNIFAFTNKNVSTKADSIIQGIQGKLINNTLLEAQLKELNSDWNQLNSKLITPIQNWIIKEQFKFYTSKNTVYYPFGGPDFLFAQAHFPQARKYILVGLENTGTLPSFDLNNAQEWANYIKKLNYSLRYLNKAGYFVTKQMMEDLKQPELNGVVHLFLLYIAKLNFVITNIEYCSINNEANLIKANKNEAKIIRIKFKDKNAVEKELIYFQQNLANNALASNKNFENYLSKQKPFHSYMKSASYILFKEDFIHHRNFILNNSCDIFQDDSGIPYQFLQKQFKTELFGNYSQTTKSFKQDYQKDLKSELDRINPTQLPFKIGYNQWVKETILLYAHNDSTRKKQIIAKTPEFEFGVQIVALSIPTSPKKLKIANLVPIQTRENKMYKYIIGYYDNYEKCVEIRNQLQKTKYPSAFIVIYKNKQRISTDEYIKLNN